LYILLRISSIPGVVGYRRAGLLAFGVRNVRLPPSVHDQSHFRLWNRRFHPLHVYTEKKRREKLNPVRRGLVGERVSGTCEKISNNA